MNWFKSYCKNLTIKKSIKPVLILSLLIWFWFLLPNPLFQDPTSYVLTDKTGKLLNASIASDGQWRFPENDRVPEKFSKCITTFEDKRFFFHPGIDPIAIGRAILDNIKHKKVVSGGSTLTMQVIRLQAGNKERNIWNKLSETLTALRLELTYSKKEILSLYCSHAPFGSNIVGLDAASWRYFGRDPTHLSWGESAALAVLPNAPSSVHPGKNSHELLLKRNRLLDKLLEKNIIDSNSCLLSKSEPLPGFPQPLPQLAPHLLERFKKENSTNNIASGTFLKTTIDFDLQGKVNSILLQHHRKLIGNKINNAAAMVVEIESGNILAYTGNVYLPMDPEVESHVDVLNSRRSPGSTLKPILYAAMLSEGSLLPRQLIPDIPTQINGYTPENFDLGYDGAVPAHRALSRSLNIPAVKMLMQYKYQRLYDVFNSCGFTTFNQPADHYGMSLILGGCEITPYELAGVYSSMVRMYNHQHANKGNWNGNDWFMPKYYDNQNAGEEKKRQLFDYASLWQTFNAMNEVMRPGEEGLWNLFGSAERIAWKTGTSFGFRDGWAIGFTPKYCVVVWIGNTTGEGRPGLTGIQTAAPVLFEIFRILPAAKWFEPPASEFIYLPVCHQSGFKAGMDCKEVDTMLVSVSAKNAKTCPYHHLIHLDPSGKFRVSDQCVSPSEMVTKSWFILPPVIEYYYKQKHAEYETLPDWFLNCQPETINGNIDIIYPEEGTIIYVPLELTGKKGNTIFTATNKNSGKLFWHLDQEYIASTENFHQLSLQPKPGKHVVTIEDENGETISRRFEVAEK